jgi:hypothetical protein
MRFNESYWLHRRKFFIIGQIDANNKYAVSLSVLLYTKQLQTC